MASPVKISDKLWALAREEAHGTHRSMTAQIEHWASLGRAVEIMAAYRDVLALKRAGEALHLPRHVDRADLHGALQALIEDPDRTVVKLRIASGRAPVYATDPEHPGRVVAVHADGTRVPGHLDGRKFVPDAERRRPSDRPAETARSRPRDRALVHARMRSARKRGKGTSPKAE